MRFQGLTLVEVVLVVLVFGAVATLVLPWLARERERREMDAAQERVLDALPVSDEREISRESTVEDGGMYAETVTQVRAVLTATEGGWGVYVEGVDAAFWVKDGQVYVVDEKARGLLPEHPWAPAAVRSQELSL